MDFLFLTIYPQGGSVFEAVAIRFLWVLHAFRLRKTPGLCPPQCDDCHTFKWPCRARVRDSAYSRYMSRPKLHRQPEVQRELFFPFATTSIGQILEIKEDESGLVVKGKLNDDQVQRFTRLMSEHH